MQTLRQKLEKCKTSIEAHIARGGTERSIRGNRLQIRYDILRLAARDSGEWRDYCKAHELDFGHDGFDMFA